MTKILQIRLTSQNRWLKLPLFSGMKWVKVVRISNLEVLIEELLEVLSV